MRILDIGGMTQEILFQNGTATMGSLQGYTGFGKIIKAGKISEFAITDDFLLMNIWNF